LLAKHNYKHTSVDNGWCSMCKGLQLQRHGMRLIRIILALLMTFLHWDSTTRASYSFAPLTASSLGDVGHDRSKFVLQQDWHVLNARLTGETVKITFNAVNPAVPTSPLSRHNLHFLQQFDPALDACPCTAKGLLVFCTFFFRRCLQLQAEQNICYM